MVVLIWLGDLMLSLLSMNVSCFAWVVKLWSQLAEPKYAWILKFGLLVTSASAFVLDNGKIHGLI